MDSDQPDMQIFSSPRAMAAAHAADPILASSIERPGKIEWDCQGSAADATVAIMRLSLVGDDLSALSRLDVKEFAGHVAQAMKQRPGACELHLTAAGDIDGRSRLVKISSRRLSEATLERFVRTVAENAGKCIIEALAGAPEIRCLYMMVDAESESISDIAGVDPDRRVMYLFDQRRHRWLKLADPDQM